MTQLIFAVLLSWNMNIGNPFHTFDKTEYGKMLDKFGKAGTKLYKEENWYLFIV